MKKIYDAKSIDYYLKKTGYEAVLKDLKKKIFLIRYEKGEFVTAPFLKEQWFQIVVLGTLNIYFIRDNGERYSLSTGKKGYILGEMELFSKNSWNIYTEAAEPLLCLALSVSENREELLDNSGFLQIICKSLSEKLASLTALDAAPCSLQQRVLSYMKYKCERGILKGIEKEAFHLHCSSRQLQRVLNELEREGKVEKIGKGTYILRDKGTVCL